MFRWGIIFLCLGLVSGCSQAPQISKEQASSTASSQATLPLKGNLISKGRWNLPEGQPCKIANVDNIRMGKDPYLNAAIQRDLKVTVKNSKSEVVALGSLGDARTVKGEEASSSNCAFPITVNNVPISDFYTISIGNIEQTLAKKDVEQGEVRIYTENDALVKLVSQ
jgi:hypothetical protein